MYSCVLSSELLFFCLSQVLQSQLAAVQGGPGEPRVLIEADPENSGGLRLVQV